MLDASREIEAYSPVVDDTEQWEKGANNLRESHSDMPEAATGRGVSKSRPDLPKDAGSSRMQLPHLDGLELIRQLWKASPCGEAATKSPCAKRGNNHTPEGGVSRNAVVPSAVGPLRVANPECQPATHGRVGGQSPGVVQTDARAAG